MEIKEGMYVRTTKGIGKVIDVIITDDEHDKYRYVLDMSEIYIFNDDDILAEPSFDIIDVIEPGDLVNDMYVETNNGVELTTDQIDYASSGLGHVEYETIYMTSIEKVITKEQLAAMVYEVKK